MVGGTYLYDAKYHKILSFNINDDEVMLVTDKNWFRFNGDAERQLRKFLPCDDNQQQLVKIDNKKIGDITEIVLDNINKIKDDKSYIPIARALK